MSKSRRSRSKATPPAKKRRVHFEQRLNEITPALLPRKFTAKRLNISLAYVLRLEQAGVLTPIRLNPDAPNGQVFHSSEEVDRVARGEKA
jgi:hypothetical protein